MNKLTKKTKAICLILAVVIIAGIVVMATVGFNIELRMKMNLKEYMDLEPCIQTFVFQF